MESATRALTQASAGALARRASKHIGTGTPTIILQIPIGGRGIGELGATGVAAAVANAVFQATGKRVRELPITPAALIMS